MWGAILKFFGAIGEFFELLDSWRNQEIGMDEQKVNDCEVALGVEEAMRKASINSPTSKQGLEDDLHRGKA